MTLYAEIESPAVFHTLHEQRIRQLADRVARDLQAQREQDRLDRQRYRERQRKARGTPICWRRVRCLASGEVFPSIAAAARSRGLRPRALTEALRNGTRCGGIAWAYEGGPGPSKPPRSRAIVRRCDGRRFEAMADVLPPCQSKREYRREHQRLAQCIRRGWAYRGFIYAYAVGARLQLEEECVE